MMNKAQKKLHEVQAIAEVYEAVNAPFESHLREIGWWKEAKENFIKEQDLPFPEAIDTEYYDNYIEEHEAKVKAIEKVLDTIYKLM